MVTVKQMLNAASEFFGNSPAEIIEKVRYSHIIRIRQFIMALAESLLIPDEEIAVILNMERTNVVGGRKRFHYQYENNRDYRDSYDEFKEFVVPSKIERKTFICFPGLTEYEEMSVTELTQHKLKAEHLEEYLKRLIRKKIQQ